MANKKSTSSKDIAGEAIVETTETEIQESPAPLKGKKEITPKNIDPSTIITVVNGFNGKLVYISPRTHEKYVWDDFGDEQEIELRELRNAKSSAKKFFMNNWFMFDSENDWVIPYLGLNKYYQDAISLDEFETLFDNTPSEVEAKIAKLSAGQKRSLSYKVRAMVADGEIDSLKMIEVLEKTLGVELVEK